MAGPWEKYAAPAAAPAPSAAPSPEAAAGPWSTYATGTEAADQKAPPPAAELHTYSTRGPNGRTITFQGPADASDDEIRRLAVKATGSRLYARSAIKRDGTPLPRTDTSALSGLVAGALKPVDKAAEWIANTPVGAAIDRAGVAMGFPSTAEGNAEHADWRANNSRTGYQTLGEIAGTLPLARVPGGAAVQGGLSGALLTDAHDLYGTVKDAAFGAVGGQLGQTAIRGLGALASGVTSRGARLLNDAGVPLTLGQIGRAANNLPGRIAAGLEERLAGFPIVGDVINAARDRGTDAYNRTIANRALEAATAASGRVERLPANVATGREAIAHVGDRLSARYNQLVPNLAVQPDQAFMAAGNRALAETRTLPDTMRDQYGRIINSIMENRAPNGALRGDALKEAESKLTGFIRSYSSSGDPDQRGMAAALSVYREGLRDLVERQNPRFRGELQGLNRGWAQLATLESAAGGVGNTTGVVTPKGYASAARMADSSVRRRATVRGEYPNQPLTDAAADILPNRTPDSGTAGRAALFLGAGAGGGAAYIDPREHPFLAASLGTAAAVSTRPGQVALNRLAFGARPGAVSALAVPLNRLSRYAPQAIAPLLVTPQQ